MYQSMTHRIARLVGRDGRTEARLARNRLRAARIVQTSPGGKPTTGRVEQWLLTVPWRHVWILALLILLLVFALFGFFPTH